jgi:hypothetical protein
MATEYERPDEETPDEQDDLAGMLVGASLGWRRADDPFDDEFWREEKRKALEAYARHPAVRVRKARKRKVSVIAKLLEAKAAGATSATVTPDGVVSATFVEPAQAAAAVNSWTSAIADLEAKQGRR